MGLPNLKRCTLPGSGGCSRSPDRTDALIMAVVSILYAGVAFTGLGNTESPESFVPMENYTAFIRLPGDSFPSKIMLFSGVGEGSYHIDFSEDGLSWESAGDFQQEHVSVLKWNELVSDCETVPRYAAVTGMGPVYLGEIAFVDADGGIIPASPTAFADEASEADRLSKYLVDEQDTVPPWETYLNSSYFDEIYHARTAWEHLNGIKPYEISHPPLGKLIIALGIKIFGMNPFGWRFMGTLFGVLMLPLMYIIAKKMFGGRAVPAACMLVFAGDFMHFTQTRIATIDTYGVFFILLMYLFMYLFISGSQESGPDRQSLVYLALSGLFFGMGAASKWTAIYAGAGLAVIWAAYWIINHALGFRAFVKNSLFCIVFFVLVPCLIYYVSYFPYGQAAGLRGFGMFFSKEYAELVLDNQKFMFTYHSGLVAEHPYSSKWYQWLLDIKPILYYLKYFSDGSRSSFGAFVNPALCWGGLLSLPVLVYTGIFRKDRTAAFIVVGYLAQLLPWVLITRLTFEYHYFPCTVFLIMALGYVFKLIRLGNRRWKWYVGGFVLVSTSLFVLFYPAISGMLVDNTLATRLLGWLPTWPF
ncbi:MAG: glycosyltransferase family 39 protein [Candidatus Limivicinus sp.]